MNKKDMHFCIECGHDVAYNVESNRVEITARGVTFSYVEMTAICTECGEPIYVPEVNDENISSMEEAYRTAKKIITISELQELLKKYNIGAGPLAKLLGYGSITINRYVLGQLPSKAHSDELLELKSNVVKMDALLEERKDLISKSAYEKSRKALDDLDELYGGDKIDVVARYIINKSGDITAMSLQKLLYYVQAFYKALFGKPIFENDCQAWVHGPVYPEIYYKYKKYGPNLIDVPVDGGHREMEKLSDVEKNFLDTILFAFGNYSGKILKEMTHKEKPWLEARGTLLPQDRSTNIIKKTTINEYFKDVIEKYNIINPCDISEYSTKMYEKVRCL